MRMSKEKSMAKAEYWYHATDKKVLGSIVISGIEPGIDGGSLSGRQL